MKVRQGAALFVGSLVLYTIGNGLLPLLPVYAQQPHIAADRVWIGYYLAFAYVALAAGSLLAGWISDRLQIRKPLFIVAGLLAIPGTWLMGQVEDFWLLALLTAIVWMLVGMGLALVSILAGLFATKEQRGRVFGALGLTIGLGSLIGGLSLGPLADRWGYPTMFLWLAGFLFLWPLAGLLAEDKVVERRAPRAAGAPSDLTAPFFFLLAANLIAISTNFVANLARSLAMGDLGFTSSEISSTVTVNGIVALPFPLLIGWLSDRLGRRSLIALCYIAGTAGMAVLAYASWTGGLWDFRGGFALMALLLVSYSIGSALVADLVPQTALGTAMSLFSATAWGGGIVGFLSTGYALEILGPIQTFAIGAALPLVALLLLFFVR